MKTGPEGILSDIVSSVGQRGTYEVDYSILTSGVFTSEADLRSWAEGQGLRYEVEEVERGTATHKVAVFSRGA
ncbi:MAG TPA: hypothetical protein VER08_12350 [Pyrinomonadaceae bacterium]|nr:hypothetical protein [Pyrinomonadaceae bacterium]